MTQQELMHDFIDGFELAQNKYIDAPFRALAEVLGDANIIEIGTAKGGFAIFLAQTFKQPIHTFDTMVPVDNIQIRQDVFNKYRIEFVLGDVFKHGIIEKIISQPRRCLVLCDNGDKIREFRHFAMFLKKNDIIMAHDYAPDGNFFNDEIRGKYWNFFEIGDGHVQDVCDEYGLVPFMQEDFIFALWKICIKK